MIPLDKHGNWISGFAKCFCCKKKYIFFVLCGYIFYDIYKLGLQSLTANVI